MAHIELKKVTKYFTNTLGERVTGLDCIDLTIERGEVIGIIGTNGAGKSTLFNCLAGQEKLDDGGIYIDGQRIDTLKPRHYAQKVSRVFQDARLGTAPRMTVFENLVLASKRGEKRRLSRSLTPENEKQLHEKLASFKLDLEQRLHVPMEVLSGGQRQAIALLMATLQQPELLLLDEHTAALDPRTAQQVMTLTKQLIHTHQLTAVMITHRLQDALTYCDRIIAMHKGRIFRQFTKTELSQLNIADLFLLLENMIEEP